MYNFQSAHREQVGLLGADGRMFSGPHGCKDYVHDSVCELLYPNYVSLMGAYRPEPTRIDSPPSFERPEFTLFCDVNRAERNGEKFRNLMNQLESRMGLSQTEIVMPECGKTEKSAPFIARTDAFWLRSPVLLSAYLTFLRLAIRMHMGEPLDDFLTRMLDKAKSPGKDSGFLRVANKNGNLSGLIERRLPCMNREAYSDYLLSSHSRGFAWYHAASDDTLPIKEADLFNLRIEGRKHEAMKYEYDI